LAPSETPAIFSLLQALEFVNGIYYPEGGFQSVTSALVNIATARGVKILTSNSVSSLVIEGNKIVSGCETIAGFVPSDATILNVDAPEAEARLLPDEKNRDARTLSCRPSCGIVQLSFGLKRRLSSLAHHNLFLSVEPEEVVWESILNPDSSKVFNPKAFNFYVHAPARTDPSCCPADHDAITVLVPVTPLPNGHTLKDQDDLVATVREHVLQRLGDSCGEIRKQDIACEMNRSPITWHREFGLFRGQAFGLAHNLGQLSLLRPAIQHPKIDNLFRVGASTRPGNGVPLSLVSGRLAAETAQRHFQTRIKQPHKQ
jgi:phytoene desaturase